MLPILLSIGPIKIYSYGVFLAIALFIGLYFWWKMGRDEHFDETELFDGFFLSLLSFFLGGRLAYVLLHADLHTWYRSVAFLAYPGLSVSAGIVLAVIYMVLYARAKGWETSRVLDVVAVTLAGIIMIGSIGALLNGTNPGIVSNMGMVFPGDSDKRLSVDFWTLLWGIFTFGVVSRVRKQFRFFAWYKGEASTAKEGLAFLFLLLLTGFYLMVAGLIDDVRFKIWVIPGITLLGFLLVLASGAIIYFRSGRARQVDLLQWVSQLRKRR